MSRSLLVEVERNDVIAVIRLRGSAGVLEVQHLRDCLDALIAQEVPKIFLDLNDVDCVGALTVAAIAAGYSRHRQTRIRLLPPHNAAGQVLAHSSLAGLLSRSPLSEVESPSVVN